MGIVEVLLLAVGLSMDAFAVAVCRGLCLEKVDWRQPLTVGAWFGIFQGLMPLLGYLLGSAFIQYIEGVDHWIAFILLGLIGANMIKESFSKEKESESCDVGLGFKTMFVLAIATSIDALAAGLSMLVGFDFATAVGGTIPALFVTAGCICLITFALSALGVKIGNLFGSRFKSKAELAGGIILILLGVKILLEHMGILSF